MPVINTQIYAHVYSVYESYRRLAAYYIYISIGNISSIIYLEYNVDAAPIIVLWKYINITRNLTRQNWKIK